MVRARSKFSRLIGKARHGLGLSTKPREPKQGPSRPSGHPSLKQTFWFVFGTVAGMAAMQAGAIDKPLDEVRTLAIKSLGGLPPQDGDGAKEAAAATTPTPAPAPAPAEAEVRTPQVGAPLPAGVAHPLFPTPLNNGNGEPPSAATLRQVTHALQQAGPANQTPPPPAEEAISSELVEAIGLARRRAVIEEDTDEAGLSFGPLDDTGEQDTGVSVRLPQRQAMTAEEEDEAIPEEPLEPIQQGPSYTVIQRFKDSVLVRQDNQVMSIAVGGVLPDGKKLLGVDEKSGVLILEDETQNQPPAPETGIPQADEKES